MNEQGRDPHDPPKDLEQAIRWFFDDMERLHPETQLPVNIIMPICLLKSGFDKLRGVKYESPFRNRFDNSANRSE